MRTKVISVIFVIALFMPAIVFAGTTVHQLAWWDDSVSGGKSLYQSASKYGNAVTFADNAWSALGKVDIRPPNSNEYPNLAWWDYSDPNDPYDGYEVNNNPGYIYLNTAKLDSTNDFTKQAVATHELGHAMGIGDHYAGYENGVALMYSCARCTGRNTPQAHDQADFYTRWP